MNERKCYIIKMFTVGGMIASLLITESVSHFNKDSNWNSEYVPPPHVVNVKPDFDKTPFTEYRNLGSINQSSGSQGYVTFNLNNEN